MEERIDGIISEINKCENQEQLYETLVKNFDAFQKNNSKSDSYEKEKKDNNIFHFLGIFNSYIYNLAGYKLLKKTAIKDQLKVLAECIFKLKKGDGNKEEKYIKLLEEDAVNYKACEDKLKEAKKENEKLISDLENKEKEIDSYLRLIQIVLGKTEDLPESDDKNLIKENIEITLKTNGIQADWNADERQEEKFEITKTEIKRTRKVSYPCLLRWGEIIRLGAIYEEVEK